jgi:hypothetical protein
MIGWEVTDELEIILKEEGVAQSRYYLGFSWGTRENHGDHI